MDNMTDSQKFRALLAAVRREAEALKGEVVEISEKTLSEIQALRKEVTEQREAERELLNQYRIRVARQEQFMKRIANSILALFGKGDDA